MNKWMHGWREGEMELNGWIFSRREHGDGPKYHILDSQEKKTLIKQSVATFIIHSTDS